MNTAPCLDAPPRLNLVTHQEPLRNLKQRFARLLRITARAGVFVVLVIGIYHLPIIEKNTPDRNRQTKYATIQPLYHWVGYYRAAITK